MKEVGLVARIATAFGPDHPVRAAGRGDARAARRDDLQEAPARPALAGTAPVADAFVHGAVIAGEDLGITGELRDEDGLAVEVDGEPERGAGPQASPDQRQQ